MSRHDKASVYCAATIPWSDWACVGVAAETLYVVGVHRV